MERVAWLRRVALGLLVGSLAACASAVTLDPDAATYRDPGPDVDAGGPCELGNDALCPRGATCPYGDRCNTCFCGLDGTLTCTTVVCAAPDASVTEAGAEGCTDTASCGAGRVCAFHTAGCGGRGVCEAALLCNRVPEAYCGCDGITHQTPTCNAPPAAYTTLSACSAPTVDCNVRDVRCQRPPPRCAPGTYPAVQGGCFSACVPWSQCAPIPCDASGPQRCPGNLTCDDATAMCVPQMH